MRVLCGVVVFVTGCAARQPSCTYRLPPSWSFQTTPVVYGRTLIITTASYTRAIDARTCRERWRFDYDNHGVGLPMNRGGVVAGDLFVRGMPDGHLVALDARSGAVRWIRQIANPSLHETLTMQPAAWDSLVFIGPAGSEDGVRGWVGAYRIGDGAEVWRFSTLTDSTTLGGSVWTRFVVDSTTGILYAAVGNPAPDFAPELRPGANLYTNSVVALDARTGRLLWFNQLTPNDTHDWDLTTVGPLIGDMLIAAGKDGIVRALDTRNGRLLWETAVSRREHVDEAPTATGTHACPGPFGGVQWSGGTYDARSRLLYIPSVEWCATYYYEPETAVGGYYIPDSTRAGRLTAIDPQRGTIRWTYHSTAPMLASVAVVGDTVITGEMSGALVGLDADSGHIIFRIPTEQIGGAVVTYRVDGTRYLAFPSGAVSAIMPRAHGGDPTITIMRR